MKYILGIDTSCYTTSVAVMDETGNLVADERRILTVKTGGRGLQQSEMVFQHTRNLPELIEQAFTKVKKPFSLKAIGVSACPRSLPDSYMPVFLTGLGYARALAVSHRIPLIRLSHQENHIWAGIWSAEGPNVTEFLALHLSGGTTELVKVEKENNGLSLTCLGGTLDISAGQFIDRIGVALGLPFPAGQYLEMLAKESPENIISIPFFVKRFSLSFSGSETYVRKLLAANTIKPAAIAAGVQLCVAKALTKWIDTGIQVTGLTHILFVGGVISNQFIRNYLVSQFSVKRGISLYFPKIGYSADNSVGAAFFAAKK